MNTEILDYFKTRLKWVRNERRKKLTLNNERPFSMVFGDRWWYGKYGPSKATILYPDLYLLLLEFIKNHDPSFKFTNIIINKNFKCEAHKDKNNSDQSLIIGLGDYFGGELVINGIPNDIKNKWVKFDGKNNLHYVTDFTGDRFTIVYYTNTHKY